MPKHFVAHGSPAGGLNTASVSGGERELRSLYLYPFEQVIRRTDPLAVMSCYSCYDGVAVSASRYYMTDILRGELGFRGYVYSDWGSVERVHSFHYVAEDYDDAARRSLVAGVDLDVDAAYGSLEKAVEEGEIDIACVDEAVRRILRTKFELGLFDDPEHDPARVGTIVHCAAHVALAKEVADESAVLLENDGILPLDPARLRRVALLGPNSRQTVFGDYCWTERDADYGVNLYDGLKEALGEGVDLSSLELPGRQLDLLKAVEATGTPMVVVFLSGRPLALPWVKEHADAVVVQWYAGEQQGRSMADLLTGRVNPSGRLNVSFPRSTGNTPCFYNYLPTDREHRFDRPGTPDDPKGHYVFDTPRPLWAFGRGLSYTSFEYESCRLNGTRFTPADTIRATVRVRNTGGRAGKEVVQLYVRDRFASVVTPVQQLRAFRKVEIPAGGCADVELEVPVDALALWNDRMERTVEPGDFEIRIGAASDDIRFRETVTVRP